MLGNIDHFIAMSNSSDTDNSDIIYTFEEYDNNGNPIRVSHVSDPYEFKTALYIYSIGTRLSDCAVFDFEKALDQLIETGEAEFIYFAGRDWTRFNYTKGLDALIRIGNPEFIYLAGLNWRRFDYEKGFKVLIEIGDLDYITLALEGWSTKKKLICKGVV